MRWIGDYIWLIATAVTYVVYGEHLAVAGAVPILPLMVVVRIALTRGAVAGNLMGFACGLLLDAASLEWFGSAMLVGSVIGYASGSVRGRVVVDSAFARFIVLLLAAVAYTTLVVGVRTVITPQLAPESFLTAVGSALLTALYGGVWWSVSQFFRGLIGWRSVWDAEGQ